MAKKPAAKPATKPAAKPVAKVAAKPAAKPVAKAPAKKVAVAKTASKTKATISQCELMKKIADRAYYVWLDSGKPEGRDYENWKQAEAEIKAVYNIK